MNFNKRINGSWVDTPNYIHNTSTDTITTLPAVLYPNDTTATVGISGNMEQNGTPTPSNPIQPQETGDRTGNLFDKNTITPDKFVTTGGENSSTNYYCSDYIPVSEGAYYLANIAGSSVQQGYVVYDSNKQAIRQGTISGGKAVSGVVNISANEYYIRINMRIETSPDVVMLNLGSTALPYEPYGYKIPILSGGTTTPVYLGEVQTERKIKKYVFTGQEAWSFNDATGVLYTFDINDFLAAEGITCACSHYPAQANANGVSGVQNKHVCFRASTYNQFYLKDTDFNSADALKSYFAQQHAAGTPVTMWYVLANEETGIVNEPLMRIGDYADTVSGITIPTITGKDTFDVQTTLKPSEVELTYTGWHDADVHVYPDSSWMPTSWEEFRKAVRSGKAQSLYPVGTKLYENWGDTTSDAWIVVDYPTGEDYLDSDLAQQGYTNRVMLMEEKLNYLRQFDAIEAWLYVETAIPAGTYRFTIPNYDASYGGNKTYIFTSTANVPVGGQLALTWAYQQNPSAVQAYSSSTSTSALFNVSITEWDGTTACTDLGTIKLAQNDADSTYGKLNHIHRARYGSNNYYQSGYRQWLNTNASANWWTPTNVFDRPYGNRTNAGRLNVMNSNMKSVLATPTVNCITNNLFEYPSLDGTTFSLQTAYTVKDKLFPVTHSEVNLSSSPNVNSVLDYYVNAQNADRIKYRKDNGNAYYWWLRPPYPAHASHVRYVLTSGALSYNLAYSTYGSAAACIIQ